MRVTLAVPSRKRRKRALERAKGFYGARSKRIRTVYDAIDMADSHAYRGRKQKKRQYRQLWTVRINAACRMNDFTYSKLIAGLKKAGITRVVTIVNPRTKQSEQHPICDIASSHMARRTFIGNLYKKVKDPNLVGKLSGHCEGSKAFARYRDIDDDMIKEMTSLLD